MEVALTVLLDGANASVGRSCSLALVPLKYSWQYEADIIAEMFSILTVVKVFNGIRRDFY